MAFGWQSWWGSGGRGGREFGMGSAGRGGGVWVTGGGGGWGALARHLRCCVGSLVGCVGPTHPLARRAHCPIAHTSLGILRAHESHHSWAHDSGPEAWPGRVDRSRSRQSTMKTLSRFLLGACFAEGRDAWQLFHIGGNRNLPKIDPGRCRSADCPIMGKSTFLELPVCSGTTQLYGYVSGHACGCDTKL